MGRVSYITPGARWVERERQMEGEGAGRNGREGGFVDASNLFKSGKRQKKKKKSDEHLSQFFGSEGDCFVRTRL